MTFGKCQECEAIMSFKYFKEYQAFTGSDISSENISYEFRDELDTRYCQPKLVVSCRCCSPRLSDSNSLLVRDAGIQIDYARFDNEYEPNTEYSNGILKHGNAFKVYWEHRTPSLRSFQDFESSFVGTYESKADFLQSFESLDIDKSLLPYIDIDKYIENILIDFSIFASENTYYVFNFEA